MNLTEALALLDTRDKELKAANERAETLGKDKTTLDARVKSLETELDTCLKGASEITTQVDAALKQAGAPLSIDVAPTKEGDKSSLKVLSVAERITFVATERDKANDALIDRDVEALVGEKISAAQKGDFVALAKKDRTMFDSIVRNLQPLGLTQRLMKADPNPRPQLGAKAKDGGGEDLGTMLEDSAGDNTNGASANLGSMLGGE